jgi:hypothetical protein
MQRPPIALALHEREAMDLARGDAVVPREGEPGFDGGQVVLQAPREARQCIKATVHRLGHPRLQSGAPALPDHDQKGLAQRLRPRHGRVHLAQLMPIRLRGARSLGGQADHGE